MKIAVVGATGPLGRQILERALAQGHSVIAAVRRPEALQDLEEKFNSEEKRLESRRADVFSSESLAEHFAGCDAVLGALGPAFGFKREETLMTNSTAAVVAGMKTAGVTRFVICTSIGVDLDPNPTWRARIAYCGFSTFFGAIVRDFRNAEKFLESSEEAKDVNFTIVKPSRLLNSEFNSKPLIAVESQRPRIPIQAKIPRANVAQFMLDAIDSGAWDRKLVTITY